MKIVEAHHFWPNWAAQSLRSQKTYAIGFVVPNLTNGFFGQVGMTVDSFFRKHCYSTLICFTSNDHTVELESLNSLINKNVDGIIFAPVGYAADYLSKVPRLAWKPLVIIDNVCRGIRANHVLHDNVHGARVLVEHLIEHGHGRIACVTGPIEETSGAERLRGYEEALRRHGLVPDKSLIRITSWEINGGDEAVRDLFRGGAGRPTAAFFANSQLLLGGYKAFNALKLDIPTNVAVVCFDTPHVIDSLVPRPTTLERFEAGIGLTAAGILFDLIQGKEGVRTRTVRIRRDLSLGHSCGCVGGAL